MYPTTVQDQYATGLNPQHVTDDIIEYYDLAMDDDRLVKMVVNSFEENVAYWNKPPFLLRRTDEENIRYLIGDQVDRSKILPHESPGTDNRLHAGMRAILAYATGQLAKPELLPSKTDDRYKRMASNMASFLYQHALDHNVNLEMRLALKNLVARKRGYLKLRFDPDCGPYGDIITENIDPSDIVIDRYTGFRDDPNIIYHRQRCTVEQLCAKFPDKEQEIYQAFDIKRGVYTQLSRMATYWEAWFTYYDENWQQCQGLMWFLPKNRCILGKVKNPNWLYKGSAKNQKVINITSYPPKPFIILNYLSFGRSVIDETCLLDQAIPLQDSLNKRHRQIISNADYANGRLLVDKRVMSETDAQKFVNKNPKTVGMIDTTEVNNELQKAVMHLQIPALPSYVAENLFDLRSEIDTMLGTPVQFRGEMPQSKNPTLGQDLLIKNQAGALQDDLVAVVNQGYRDYYQLLLQMCTVYLDDNYWVMTKGSDGEYAQIQLHEDNLDTNVRISVITDSTLPLDKQSLRATAIQLAQMNKIDELSLYEMLGLPDPEKLVERHIRSVMDPYTYMESVEQKMANYEAEADIGLIIRGKEPEDRDDYNEDYFNHWNIFISSNHFTQLKIEQQQRLLAFLRKVSNKAAVTEALRGSMLNPAGILDRPPTPPMPKRDVRIYGQLDPQQSAMMAGMPPQQAVGGGQSSPNTPPMAGSNQGSPPRLINPTQFGH